LIRLDELLATAFGSALAALLLSRLGVAGTIVGAALTPVLITLTSALVSRQISRARDLIRATPRNGGPALSWLSPPAGLTRRQLASALVTAAAAFAISATAITIAEALTGKPVSRWGHRGGSGYTFGNRGSEQRVAPNSSRIPAAPSSGGTVRPGTERAPTPPPAQTEQPRTETQPRAGATNTQRNFAPPSTTTTP
jgi:hypothetical protein